MRKYDQVYEIKLDFSERDNDPEVVYSTMIAAIRLFKATDSVIASSISSRNTLRLSLDHVDNGSLRSFIRSNAEFSDDELRSEDEKNLEEKVRDYFERSRTAITQGLLEIEELETEEQLKGISDEIIKAADESGMSKEPMYRPPTTKDLSKVARVAENLYSSIGDDSRIYLIDRNQDAIELPKSLKVDSSLFEETSTKKIKSERELILRVKKPDYLGNSRWEMKHGKKNIRCKILNEEWKEKFRHKEILVFPGDSLECIVQIEEEYDETGELVHTDYQIKDVIRVISGTA